MIMNRMRALELHRKARGKIQAYPTINANTEEDIALAYVPGSIVAAEEIQKDPEQSFEYTGRSNRIAVISDGSAIFGLGDVGPLAALPVIEGKCLLFKLFGDINALPLCLDCNDPDNMALVGRTIAPNFGAINVEDVSSPNTFTLVRELQSRIDIPVFCDDQHGTAVVTLAALKNALEIVGKNLEETTIALSGAGAAGIATAELLIAAGARNIIMVNANGILDEENMRMNHIQEDLSKRLNPEQRKGHLKEAMKGADIFIGLSRGGIVTQEMVSSMAERPIVFALALPDPEIIPEEAIAGGAEIVGTGGFEESANPIPNLHSSPPILRGALDIRATTLTEHMFLAAATSLASLVDRRRLSPQHIMPDLFCDEVAPRVAEAVAQAAVADGVATRPLKEGVVYDQTWQRIYGATMSRI
ncbi:MAG: NAD-dependent malic enzyme [Synergistales bacterium]|nr:NAD-dependent malic enzyme [Synergistales bacterium]